MRTERLARSGFLGLIGSASAALAAFAVAVVVGNVLGTYATGLFFQAVGFFTIANQILRLGTNSALIRSISEQHAFDRHGEAWRSVAIAVIPVAVISTGASVVIWVNAESLSNWLASPGSADQLLPLLQLMAPYIAMCAVLAVVQTASRMLNGIGVYAIAHTMLYPLTRLLCVVLAVWLIGSAFGAFAAWLSVIPLWLLIAIGLVARPMLHDWRDRSQAREPLTVASRRFWSFSSWRAVGGSLEVLLEWSDVLIVAAILPPAEAGVYAVVTRSVRAGQVVDRGMRLAAGPPISRLLARNDVAAAMTLHTKAARALILCSWPFYLALAIMSPAVLALFGPGFEIGSAPLTVIALAMMLATAAGMLQTILLQGGRSSWQVGNKAIVLAASITLNIVLVPALGLIGAALTWAFVALIDTSVAAWQVHRKLRVRLEPRKLIDAMVVPLVVFGLGLGLVRLVFGSTVPVLLVAMISLGLVYAIVLWFGRYRLGIEALWRQTPVIGPLLARRAAEEEVHR